MQYRQGTRFVYDGEEPWSKALGWGAGRGQNRVRGWRQLSSHKGDQ